MKRTPHVLCSAVLATLIAPHMGNAASVTLCENHGSGPCQTFSGPDVVGCLNWSCSNSTTCTDNAFIAYHPVTELPFSDITVTLLNSASITVGTINSPTGGYNFQNLPLDNYTVSIFSAAADKTTAVFPVSNAQSVSFFQVTAPVWNVDANGAWSSATNWRSMVPNAVDAVANFDLAITAPRTVFVDGAKVAGMLYFNNANGYTLGGGTNSVTMDVSSGQASLTVALGNHTIATPLILADDTTVSVAAGSSLTVTGTLTGTGRMLTKIGGGVAQFERLLNCYPCPTEGTLRISQKTSPDSPSGTSRWLPPDGLYRFPTGTIDLTNNALVVDYDGPVGTGMNDTRLNLQSGHLTSSTADSSHKLGYADNAGLGFTTFAGQAVDSTTLLVLYTLAGDANLDRAVNSLDFNALATNFGTSGKFWQNGDFNYDGTVNSLDFNAIATNFGRVLQGTPLGGLVPEPTTAGLIALLAARRRRRR